MVRHLLGYLFLCATFAACAQTKASPKHASDQEKIADALKGGPPFITQNAKILDWPTTKDGKYRVLRNGTSEWTCLPKVPLYQHDESMCLDAVFMQWMRDELAGRAPHITKVGVSYMYNGAWVPDIKGTAHSSDHTFHVGPHIMIITPNDVGLSAFNRDGSGGSIYVAHLPEREGLYLVIPASQWSKQ